MDRFKRFVITSLLLMSACGFTPIYGSHGGQTGVVSKALSTVAIENISDRNGQILRNKLIDRMYIHGRPQHPTSHLAISIKSTEQGLGIQKDATTTRSQVNMIATFSLRDEDGKLLHKGKAHAVASYSKLDAQYGTLASQHDAYERALGEIGEQIVNNLSLYFAEKAPQTHAP
ncbi:MAG: LPS assembly lipoprotein LptE [Bdellovibrionales bacterium]